MFYQIFLFLQVITTNKHSIYELPQELPNDVRLNILENQEISEKYINFTERNPSGHCSCQKESFVSSSKTSCKLEISRSSLFHMEIRVSLKYFVNSCLRKHFFASTLSQTLSNLIYVTILLSYNFNLNQSNLINC